MPPTKKPEGTGARAAGVSVGGDELDVRAAWVGVPEIAEDEEE